MALRGPTDVVHFLAGFDLAGQGAIVEVTPMIEAMTEDVTPLGPLGAIQHDAPIGRVNYTLSETGFLQDRQESLRRLLAAGAPPFPWPSIYGELGAATGARCNIATDLRIRTRSIVPSTTGITRVAIDYYLADAGDVYEDARLLAAGVVANVPDNGASPGTAYRLTHGSVTSAGATIALMVDMGATRWRGFPDLTLQVRQLTGNTWSDLGAAWALQRDAAGASNTIEIPGGTNIRSVIALRFTFSGTRDSYRLNGAQNLGATDLVIDGVGGTEVIEEGDRLVIGAATYTVEQVSAGSTANERNVVIAGGLVSAGINNAVITQTGTHTELRYAAAINRR